MAEPVTAEDTAGEPTPALPPELSMVVLTVRDMPALRRFYRALGWQEQAGASDDLAFFPLAGLTLALHPAGERAARVPNPGDPEEPTVTLVVRVSGSAAVDEACASAVRAGAGLASPPTDQPWGGRSAVIADPEGNRWEVLFVPQASRAT